MKKILLAAAATAVIASPAMAEITLDVSTASGFAGRGDIKNLFDYEKDGLADSLEWRYGSTSEYVAPCLQQETGNEHANRKVTKTSGGTAGEALARTNKKTWVTGYYLTGSTSTAEEITGSCPNGFNQGDFVLVSGGGSTGVLEFRDDGGPWVAAPDAIITGDED